MFKPLNCNLLELVNAKYVSAKASESLSFAESSVTLLRLNSGLPFQLRYCPSLAKKPLPSLHKDDASSNSVPKPKPKINPFENPDPALHILDLTPTTAQKPSHFLILNKFPIIAGHFILATTANKPQTALLEEDDIAAAYTVLRAWEQSPGHDKGKLFCFFNSGPYSGASQPHRHLQFLPVDAMREGLGPDEKWEPLVDIIAATPDDKNASDLVPFKIFHAPVAGDASPQTLHATYMSLHSKAHAAMHASTTASVNRVGNANAEDPFSYNLALTTTSMAIVPRISEGAPLGNGGDVGFAAFNGTLLAGTMMVKGVGEWDLLRGEEGLLESVLSGVGVPWDGDGEEGKGDDEAKL